MSTTRQPIGHTSRRVSPAAAEAVPLCVDLDGTLVRSDLLLESLLILLKMQPLYLFLLPIWLIRGRACLKSEIARRVKIRDAVFPFEEAVVQYLRQEKSRRKILLVTGSHQSLAEAVAAQTGLFDEVYGSDHKINLTGERKRDLLIDRYGMHGFDYIGDDKADLAVWPAAGEALVVSTDTGIASQAGIPFAKVFIRPQVTLRDVLGLLRVHQWSKNALILVPYFLDQRVTDTQALFTSLLAVLTMSLLASMTYIVNDMLDLQADRRNATKAKRVLPSGKVSLQFGFFTMGVLALCILLLMFWLPPLFNLVLLLYLVLTLSYSLYLKQLAIIDVGLIAALHTLRVIGGTVVLQTEWSFWLLAFSMFFFISMALAKRVVELINLRNTGRQWANGRGYRISDIPVLLSSGVCTGYISVLVVALYINSEKVLQMYEQPEALWVVCPALMYWVGRVWLKTARGEMHEDPILFAVHDRASLYVLALLVLGLLAAWTV